MVVIILKGNIVVISPMMPIVEAVLLSVVISFVVSVFWANGVMNLYFGVISSSSIVNSSSSSVVWLIEVVGCVVVNGNITSTVGDVFERVLAEVNLVTSVGTVVGEGVGVGLHLT